MLKNTFSNIGKTTRTMRRPTALDLFSGAGGLSLGLQQAGFSVVAAIENDPSCVESYRLNHPSVKIINENIISVVPRSVPCKKKSLDLIAACPPCQGFSTLKTKNRRSKTSDKRNKLVHEIIKYVLYFNPKALLIENVPGFLDSREYSNFRGKLEHSGYKIFQKVLDASDFGVPQRRKRAVVVASLSGHFAWPSKCHDRKTVRDTIGSLQDAGLSGDTWHDMSERRTKRVTEIIRRIPRDGGSRSDISERYQLDCHKRLNGFRDVYGRMSWDDVAPTITTGCCNPSKGRFIHPELNRAITVREAALLQSFPNNYKFSSCGGKASVTAQIGNALPPAFVRKIAQNILSTAL